MKAIIFDFGGTIDTGGIHWSEKFFNAFCRIGVPVEKKEFTKAYCLAEPEVYKFIKPDDTFYTTLQTQISLQVDFLKKQNMLFHFLKKNTLIKQLTDLCYSDVKDQITLSRELLKDIKLNFSTAIISNFYGNLQTVLNELMISEFFDIIIDSTVAGYRKPDEKFFRYLFKELKIPASESIMIGDSYERDIKPAKLIGCRTIWLKVKSFEKPSDISAADVVIKNLSDLREILLPSDVLAV